MPFNEKSLENLKSFQKGQSGNPAGPPKGYRKPSALLKKFSQLKKMDKETGAIFTRAEWIALKLLERAEKGDFVFVKEFFDRIEGKAVDTKKIEHSGNIGLSGLSEEELKAKLDELRNRE